MPKIMKNILEINRCSSLFRNSQLAPLGIKTPHASCLLQISVHPGISQDALSKLVFMDKSGVARHVALLEENGLVERRASDTDRRVMQLYPTEKAMSILPEIRQVFQNCADFFTADLSPEEIQVLDRLLSSMRRRADLWQEAH